MSKYHKIQTMFQRDPNTRYKTLIDGAYSMSEFEYLKDCEWEVTEKVDGTNIRVMWDNESLSFSGRTDKAHIPPHLFDYLREKFTQYKMNAVFRRNNISTRAGNDSATTICLYGEGCGQKIQKDGHRYKSDGATFILFDINIDGWWLNRDGVESIAGEFDINAVPCIGNMTLHGIHEYVKSGCEISRISEDRSYIMEGIVARPTIELRGRGGRRIITKLKVKDFDI